MEHPHFQKWKYISKWWSIFHQAMASKWWSIFQPPYFHPSTPSTMEAAGAQVAGSHVRGHRDTPMPHHHGTTGSPGFYVDPDKTQLEAIVEEKVGLGWVSGTWRMGSQDLDVSGLKKPMVIVVFLAVPFQDRATWVPNMMSTWRMCSHDL